MIILVREYLLSKFHLNNIIMKKIILTILFLVLYFFFPKNAFAQLCPAIETSCPGGSINGLCGNPLTNDGRTWCSNIVNDGSGTYRGGETNQWNIGKHWCSLAGVSTCDTRSPDSRGTINSAFSSFTVSSPNRSAGPFTLSSNFPVDPPYDMSLTPPGCGRVQGDIVTADEGVIGGNVYNSGRDCPSIPTPTPTTGPGPATPTSTPTPTTGPGPSTPTPTPPPLGFCSCNLITTSVVGSSVTATANVSCSGASTEGVDWRMDGSGVGSGGTTATFNGVSPGNHTLDAHVRYSGGRATDCPQTNFSIGSSSTPTPTPATSCTPFGGPCTRDSDCCTTNCCAGPSCGAARGTCGPPPPQPGKPNCIAPSGGQRVTSSPVELIWFAGCGGR